MLSECVLTDSVWDKLVLALSRQTIFIFSELNTSA